jgi:hypothetical protein
VKDARELRRLSRALRDAREESVPDLDWEAMEERLRALEPMEDRAGRRMEAKRLGKPLAVLAAATVAAAAAFGLLLGRPTAPKVASPVAEYVAPASDSESPPEREVFDAKAGDVSVVREGRASFTLARGGLAEMRDTDGVLTVYLDRGKLSASVEPSSKKESFVVEAAEVRVAVHGTKFSVARARDRVSVAVSEGVVLVGPGSTPGSGKLLSAPSRADFTPAGEVLGAPRKVPAAERAPVLASGETPVPSAIPSEMPPIAERSIADVEVLVSGLFTAANRCFRERESADGLRVTAQTSATFTISDAGRVTNLTFDPPLAPSVQNCIAADANALAVGSATRDISVTRRLELSR